MGPDTLADVTTLGEIMLRYSVPAGSRLETASQLDVRPGGAESNLAALLARLGRRTAWVGGLPDNALGRLAANHLRMAGELRLEHKQASLEELGQLHDPVLTKDAIAGRIRRLLAMADKRAEELGIPDTEASLTPEMLAEDA